MEKINMKRVAKADVPGLRQCSQFTCVAASITACLQAHGKDVTETDVNRVLGAEPLRGARWEEALATLQYFGMRGILIVPATLQMVKDATDKGNPVIIAWNPEGRPWSHASVISDVSDDLKTVTVMDPNCVDPQQHFKEVSSDEFYRKWMEPMGEKMVVRRPAVIVEREITEDGKQVRASLKELTPDDYVRIIAAD